MEIIIIWIITIIISMGLDLNLNFKMYKNCADMGYRANMGIICNYLKYIRRGRFDDNFIWQVIPFVNMYKALVRKDEYNKYCYDVLSTIVKHNLLFPMSDIEKEEQLNSQEEEHEEENEMQIE